MTDAVSEEVPHPLDPPEHLLRLRLVCVLLDTCGQYFDKGSSKKKLDCFLTYFQVFLTHSLRDVAVCRKLKPDCVCKIQTQKRFKRMPFIRTKQNVHIFEVMPFIKVQKDT